MLQWTPSTLTPTGVDLISHDSSQTKQKDMNMKSNRGRDFLFGVRGTRERWNVCDHRVLHALLNFQRIKKTVNRKRIKVYTIILRPTVWELPTDTSDRKWNVIIFFYSWSMKTVLTKTFQSCFTLLNFHSLWFILNF